MPPLIPNRFIIVFGADGKDNFTPMFLVIDSHTDETIAICFTKERAEIIGRLLNSVYNVAKHFPSNHPN
jgi:hypothetical protein